MYTIFEGDESFRGCLGMGNQKVTPFLKIIYPDPTITKIGTVISYLKKIKKYIDHVTHPLIAANINTVSPEIRN